MKSNNITKRDIAINISKKTGLSINYSLTLLDSFIIILTKKICENKLILKNIGSFKLIKKKSRIGRNPKTKEEYIIKERNSLSFSASKKLLEILNFNK